MICRSCGGSGIQRINDKRFRTCLDCLGQGFQPSHQNQEQSISPQQLGLQRMPVISEPIKAVVSSSVAK